MYLMCTLDVGIAIYLLKHFVKMSNNETLSVKLIMGLVKALSQKLYVTKPLIVVYYKICSRSAKAFFYIRKHTLQ